jgi:hypothetical protein
MHLDVIHVVAHAFVFPFTHWSSLTDLY